MTCRRASRLISRNCISEFCVSDLVLYLLSALPGGPVVDRTAFTGNEDIAAGRVLLLLAEVVHNFVRSGEVFCILADYNVGSVRAFLASCWFLEVD